MSGFRHFEDANFDYDPLTGVRQKLTIDSEGAFHWVTEQQTDDILRFAHESRSNFAQNERLGDLAPIGSIPIVVMYDLIRSGIWNDPDRRRKWWNSDLAKPYRTRDFKV